MYDESSTKVTSEIVQNPAGRPAVEEGDAEEEKILTSLLRSFPEFGDFQNWQFGDFRDLVGICRDSVGIRTTTSRIATWHQI